MKEILGHKLQQAFSELKINAEMAFKSNRYEVWQLEDNMFEKLCDVTDENWKEEYGWWRYATGAVVIPDEFVSINGIEVIGYKNEHEFELVKEMQQEEPEEGWKYGLQSYYGLIEHFYDTCGASTERNITAVAIEMAKENNMTLAELFSKCYKDKSEN